MKSMPLFSSSLTPVTDEAGVHFSMVCPNGTPVRCSVTRGTLIELAHAARIPWTVAFGHYRDAIERAASEVYEAGRLENGFVVVRPGDVKRVLLPSATPEVELARGVADRPTRG
jgi:hypothetical protein